MTLQEIKNKFTVSEYNKDTEDQLDYYINERDCEIGSIAYLYDHCEKELTKMNIVDVIKRSDNIEKYDKLIEDDDVLLDGEIRLYCDTSAEFITDNDCYLVWFIYDI